MSHREDFSNMLLTETGWRQGPDPRSEQDVLSLVVAWCPDEGHRIGERFQLPAGSPGPIRGFGRGDGPPPMLEPIYLRPGLIQPRGVLTANRRLSRLQLHVQVVHGEAALVTNVGTRALRVNGKEVRQSLIGPGDVLEIDDLLLLLCVRGPRDLPPIERVELHPFGRPCPLGLVGESPAMWDLRREIHEAGAQAEHVLVRGPAGAGKERVARAVHATSRRARRPLVRHNSASLVACLDESSLLGNLADHPSPGNPQRPGLVEEAAGGSLFLDEIRDLPYDQLQTLLSVIDLGAFRPLGASMPRRADIRLIASTHGATTALRPELMARLVARVRVPALGERSEDIPLVVADLLRELAREMPGKAMRYFPSGDLDAYPRLSAELMTSLLRHHWVTHVRELRALLMRSMEASPGDRLDACPIH